MKGKNGISIIAERLDNDPERYTFYNQDNSHQYIKYKVSEFHYNNIKLPRTLCIIYTIFISRFHILRKKVDLVIAESPKVGLWLGFIYKITLFNKPFIIWHFNTQSIYKGFKLYFARFAYSKCMGFIVSSRHEAIVYSEMLNLPINLFYFKFLSGPYLEDNRYLRLLEKSVKKQYIISAGFSGRDYLLLSKIASRLQDIEFIIITYPESIHGLNFSANVKIISNISEIAYCEYIANAKMFFLPVKNDETANGHLAILQAMSLKTLLMTNLTEGTKDYLIQNVNCLIFDNNDLDGTINIIIDMFNNNERNKKIIENAYSFAKNNFSIKSDIDMINRIITNVAAQ